MTGYELLCSRFGFLADTIGSSPEILKEAQKLMNAYPNGSDDNLENELINFFSFIKNYVNEQNEEESFESFLYRIIVHKNVHGTFPNSEVALRNYLSVMVANTTGARSFLKFKLKKNRLRVNTSQNRVATLVRMISESDVLRSLTFDEILTEFSAKKARKAPGTLNDIHHFFLFDCNL